MGEVVQPGFGRRLGVGRRCIDRDNGMIRLHGLKKRFRREDVLRGIDLEIGRGDRVALVGSNGAGKTTLIRCLLGEYTCEGEVRIHGRDPRHHRRAILARVGFVPQLPPPIRMPVAAFVRFVARLCDADPGRMEAVAERLGLDMARLRRRPFVKLSGGQKQKLLISVALGRDAELLVLDEPAANLDPAARQVFYQLLAERRDQAAMIIASHRLDEIAALVNRVVELDRGGIVLDDRVDDSVELGSRLQCRVVLTRPEPAFGKALAEWGFTADGEGLAWEGSVAGPDRLRFLGVLSRYAAVLGDLQLTDPAEVGRERRATGA